MTFDTETLIREIEKRKAIWDPLSEEYGNRDVKKKQWEEITNIMCEDNLTEKEKNECCKCLQKKWKNIRTSYTREIRRKSGITSGSAAARKSPYVYFEQLQFLRATEGSDTQNDETETNSIPERPFKKKKKEENLAQVRDSIIEDREKKQAYEADRMFMLSLLEDFKNIPKYRKLSTKMELIDVIKRAQMPEEISGYRHECGQSSRQYHSDRPASSHFSKSAPDRLTVCPDIYTEALSPDTNVTDASRSPEFVDVFQEN